MLARWCAWRRRAWCGRRAARAGSRPRGAPRALRAAVMGRELNLRGEELLVCQVADQSFPYLSVEQAWLGLRCVAHRRRASAQRRNVSLLPQKELVARGHTQVPPVTDCVVHAHSSATLSWSRSCSSSIEYGCKSIGLSVPVGCPRLPSAPLTLLASIAAALLLTFACCQFRLEPLVALPEDLQQDCQWSLWEHDCTLQAALWQSVPAVVVIMCGSRRRASQRSATPRVGKGARGRRPAPRALRPRAKPAPLAPRPRAWPGSLHPCLLASPFRGFSVRVSPKAGLAQGPVGGEMAGPRLSGPGPCVPGPVTTTWSPRTWPDRPGSGVQKTRDQPFLVPCCMEFKPASSTAPPIFLLLPVSGAAPLPTLATRAAVVSRGSCWCEVS